MIRLRTLGTIDLRDASGSALRSVLTQPRRFALLAYLAASSPRGFHRRDRVLALFWPSHDEKRARASLNRAIYFLRRELGDGVLLSRGDEEIGLDETRFWCDASAFGVACETRCWREAVHLYRGELLPGFFVSDADGFEEWMETTRARLRASAADAAWTQSEEDEAAGNLTQAAQWAMRAVELSPFRETGVRRLLALLDQAGDRAGAAYAYEKFFREISAELNVAPSAETRAVIDAIRSRSSAVVDAAPPREPAVESAAAVATRTVEPRPPSLDLRRRRRRRGLFAWTAAAALGAILVTASITRASDEALDASRVDVIAIENRTSDPTLDALARATTARIRTGLGETGLFARVVPIGSERGVLDAFKRLADRRPMQRKHAAVTVSGTLGVEHEKTIIRLRVTDARRGGRPWLLAPIAVPAASIENAMREAEARVVGGAAALHSDEFGSLLPLTGPPPTYEAYQELVEGHALQGRDLRDEARKHYRVATALDPSFTWPLVMGAWSAFFNMRAPHNAAGDSLLALLRGMHDRLPPLQAHLTDFMASSRAQDWAAAYRAVRAAADLAPEQYAARAANVASALNRPREAIELLGRLGTDSAYWRAAQNLLPSAYHRLGEHRNELEVTRQLRRLRPDSRTALMQQTKALAALGNIEAVNAALDTLRSAAKDRLWLTPAWAMQDIANELRAHGHHAPARAIAERAVAWHRARPAEERAMPDRRWHLGYCLYFLDRLSEADSLLRPLVAEFPTHEDYLGLMGAIAARRGDRAHAQRIADKLAQLDYAAAVQGRQTSVYRAKIAALLGDRAAALSLMKDAYGAQGTGDFHADVDMESLREDAAFREFVRPKG